MTAARLVGGPRPNVRPAVRSTGCTRGAADAPALTFQARFGKRIGKAGPRMVQLRAILRLTDA
jgi:hypothetical protein